MLAPPRCWKQSRTPRRRPQVHQRRRARCEAEEAMTDASNFTWKFWMYYDLAVHELHRHVLQAAKLNLSSSPRTLSKDHPRVPFRQPSSSARALARMLPQKHGRRWTRRQTRARGIAARANLASTRVRRHRRQMNGKNHVCPSQGWPIKLGSQPCSCSFGGSSTDDPGAHYARGWRAARIKARELGGSR